MRRTLCAAILAAVFAHGSFVTAQLLQEQPGLLPGPSVWSEGVEVFDANGDGRLDIIFTNGNGFTTASGPLAPTLLINQALPGVAAFTNETGTRIPAGFTQQGKGLTIFDANEDGAPDIVFANGFGNQPRILINDGTGVFSDETTTRLPTMSIGAFGVATPDVDNDGDSDIVFCDTGPSTLGGSGGLARLLINDGTGVFTNAPSQMNAVLKVAAMQVTSVDIDNDFDIDIIVDGRSVGQQLYINDGTGNFTFDGSTLPGGSSSVYETDWADLDNDLDIDGFYISMSGFNEGTAQSLFVDSGSLTITGTTSTLSGTNGNDDNECAYLDINNDGFLDVVVASLSGIREKIYLNAGTFAPGSFSYLSNGFTTLSDSTLDLAIGDFDEDGRYDVVTAQGESGGFANRYYKNENGSVDTLAPTIGRIETFPSTVTNFAIAAGSFNRRAWIQDQVMDSGRNYITASLMIQTSKDGVSGSSSVDMHYSDGGIYRGVIQPDPGTTGLVGMDVTVNVVATDHPGNTAMSANQVFKICGSDVYGAPSAVNSMTLTPNPDPTIGGSVVLDLTGAPANSVGALVADPDKISLPVAGGELLVDIAGAALIPVVTDASGVAQVTFGLPSNPLFAGLYLNFQVGILDASAPGGFRFSNGAEVATCGN